MSRCMELRRKRAVRIDRRVNVGCFGLEAKIADRKRPSLRHDSSGHVLVGSGVRSTP